MKNQSIIGHWMILPSHSAVFWRAMLDDTDRVSQRFSGRNKFGEDKAYRIAAATKQDNFDAMLAYAYRSKGNYFSGKKRGGALRLYRPLNNGDGQ